MNDCICGCGEKFEVNEEMEEVFYDSGLFHPIWGYNVEMHYWAACDNCGMTKMYKDYSSAYDAAKAGKYSPWREWDNEEIESMRRILE